MCGIAGVAGAGSQAEGEELARRMSAAIAHRGPDEDGAWADDRVALAMCRLSIIDLEGGHQPMTAPSGATLVFNGEIYNYRELRAELERAGRSFRTDSDTEVVLQVLDAGGIEAVDKLRGMFAIAWHDPDTHTLHLVRDRLGKKPLYYLRDGDRLLFASELKGLLEALPARPALDLQAIHHYLTLRYVPGPGTVWQGVRKLEPGHRLAYDVRDGSTTVTPYWSLEFRAEPLDPDRDYVAEFEELLLDAVESRLVAADVPVGVLLSGGLDSSAVSAAAVEMGHKAFHTFSIGFEDGGEYSELPYARQMAEHVGSRHHEVLIGQDDFVDFLPELVHWTDEPLADLASVPLHFVAREARKHVKVVLSGEGSDEVLAGYDIDQLGAQLERLRRFARLPRPLLATGARVTSSNRLAMLARDGYAGYLGGLRTHMTHVWDEDEKRQLWRSSAAAGGFDSTDDLIGSWYAQTRSPEPIDQLQQVYCGSWLVEDLLMKADKMTMATSLELRVPFLDHPLVEWASRLPLEWRIGSAQTGWSSKRILREFARRRLPQSIVDRPKRGFPVPAVEWLRGPLGGWASDRLTAPRARIGELIDTAQLEPTIERARGGDRAAAERVWAAVVLDFWLERWT